MGCYTQFHANISLRKDTPDDVVLLIMHGIYDPEFWPACIDHMNDIYGAHPLILLEHPFFKTERWDLIFMRSSYGEPTEAKFIRTPSGYYELEINCDINYGHQEVQTFIDWIKPHVAGRKKRQYIGWWTNDNVTWRANEYIER